VLSIDSPVSPELVARLGEAIGADMLRAIDIVAD
jgi:hypothetical protein